MRIIFPDVLKAESLSNILWSTKKLAQLQEKGYKILNLFAKNVWLLGNNDTIILVQNINFNFVVTRQYLLKSHTNFTITLRQKPKSKILAMIQ